MANVPPQVLEQYREAFSCFAAHHLPPGQGTISVKDLPTLIRALGKNPNQEECQKLLSEIDSTGEGSIDFNTFCRCMTKNFPAASTEAEVMEAFRAFDKNHSGVMSTLELMTVMRSFGESLQDDEVDEMMKAAATCEVKPGQVDYRRFTALLLR